MRKRYIISFMIFIFAFGSASAKCGWHIHVEVYNNGISVNHIYMINLGTTAYYVEIAPGDSLKVGAGGNSNCWPNWFVLIHDSDTIYNANLTNSYYATFVDTGHYYCQYQNFDMLPDWYAILDLYVSNHVETGTNVASLIKPLTVFPIVSHDIFSIESEFELKELIVSDVAGRIYNIALAGNNSQINLGSFPSGIYFYAITDEKEKVWRGRLIKD